jgi:hypothetical protein
MKSLTRLLCVLGLLMSVAFVLPDVSAAALNSTKAEDLATDRNSSRNETEKSKATPPLLYG